MIPYFIFLAFAVLAVYFSKQRNYSKLTMFFVLLIMVLFAGLRSSSVGTDAGGYARGFENDVEELNGTFKENITKEPGFWLLKYFLSLYSSEYVIFFIGIALLCYSCVLRAIKQNTDNIAMALFVFITLGLYTFVFNAARQGIAVGIYMLSFKYLFEDDRSSFLKYCLLVLLAAMFHKTVIVALPLYFLFRMPYSPKMLGIIALLGIAIGVVLPSFLAYAGTLEYRYSFYSEYVGGAEMLTVFYILVTAFFIFWRRNIDEFYLRRYDIFLNMMLFGTLIYIIVQVKSVYVEMTRFAAYFQVAAIFLWSYIYSSERKPRSVFSAAIILGHLAYFYIFCSQMAGLVPYRFNEYIFQ